MTLKSIPFDFVQQTYGVKENVQPCGAFRNRPLRARTDPFWDDFRNCIHLQSPLSLFDRAQKKRGLYRQPSYMYAIGSASLSLSNGDIELIVPPRAPLRSGPFASIHLRDFNRELCSQQQGEKNSTMSVSALWQSLCPGFTRARVAGSKTRPLSAPETPHRAMGETVAPPTK